MKAAPNIRKKKSPIKKEAEHTSFPIVAIGASAGGLEAMSILLKNLPSNTGMAYIYVQHLSPNHKSFLTSILSKITKMKVQEIDDMELMKPNNVYVIPPNKEIKVIDGHIRLVPRPKKGASNLSVDLLFKTLAETHKKYIIGVVLSGYASDGMIGLKAIKDAGGITFAQDDTAQASSMPHSAIASGVVDFVLSPKEIANSLVQISKNGFPKNSRVSLRSEHSALKQTLNLSKGSLAPRLKLKASRGRKKSTHNEEKMENNNSHLKTIFELLHKETGVDFSHYKMPTIKRRLNHKMLQSGAKKIEEYLKLLQKDNKEVDLLYKDLLINVTSFFRDPEAFKYLKTSLLPKIIKSKQPNETLRIWVPACSTGQEAYSIAMLIIELQDKKVKKIPVKIFASDLSENAIRIARIGEYSQSEIEAVPKKYQERFFIKTGDKYQIVKELREMCVFAPHNILRDPPFSRMDFISCRNLLIYFDSAAQKRVFATLHFTLKDGGHLMLGKAETIGTSSQLFKPVNNKLKFYSRKKNTGVRKIPELTPHYPNIKYNNKKQILSSKSTSANPAGIEDAIDSVLLSRYMPACAVVNKDMEILQFRGPISLFLTHPSGKASLNILKIARPEFVYELRNAIHKAIKTKQLIHKADIEINPDNFREGSISRKMTLEVSPLKMEWDEPLLLIVFTLQQQVEKIIINGTGGKNTSTQKDNRIKKLTEELGNTRAEINSILETQETVHEELQAANEEAVSSNEEFQTLNEELETSKEEIEATNEELISTNQELQMRNDLLAESQEYSDAIIATIHEPMLVLNKDFHIKSANKSFYKKFLVKKEETEGKFLFELGNEQWNIPKLRKMLNEILTKNKGFENFEVTHTFPDIGEKIMVLNAHLIIQKTHSEQLILLAISDVTEVRKLANELLLKEAKVLQNEEREKWAAELLLANKKLIFQNEEKAKRAGELMIANKELEFQIEEKEKRAAELVLANKELLFQTSEKEKRAAELVIADIELNFQNKEKEKREIANKELKAHNDSIKMASQYARSLIEASLDPLVTINAEGKITDVNEALIKTTGVTREKLIGTDFSIYYTEPIKAQAAYRQTFKKGFVTNYPLTIKHKNGNLTDVLYNASVYKDDNGKVLGVFAAARDITEQKKIATELNEAKIVAELAREAAESAKEKAQAATRIAEEAVQSKQQFLSNMSHEIRTPMNAIIGFTKVILKTDISAKQKEYLNAIKISGEALTVLINDILDLAKVDSGKMTFEHTPFKMKISISAMLHLFETTIQEKNIEFVKNYDDKIPEVLLGDPVRLHQIILNLVSNAVKFTEHGKISVSVHLLSEDDEKVTIKFAVMDTGIGISDDKMLSVFEVFQQASSDTSRLYGGTGLGLAIVKQLVEGQGGSVHVESKVNKGSTFSFILSFQKTNTQVTDSYRDEIGGANLEFGNIKVLVVEDIALNQLLMKTLLDEFGFERDVADNGEVAIEKLQKNKYDIILMDLQMPEMNGFEATEYIRNTMHSQIPIIALTADVTTADVEKCIAVGMNDYISKPVDEKLLYSKIIHHLKKPNTTNKIDIKEKCINLDYLKQLTKNNSSAIAEMITVYLEETPPLIKGMKQAIDTKNWELLRVTAHSIIPSFSMMGINSDFGKMAKKIQEYATHLLEEHTGEYPEKETTVTLKELLYKIETICSQASEELKKELLVLNSN